jgi:hypothetical protein
MKSLCFALAIAISGAALAQDSLATASVRPAASGADGSYCRGALTPPIPKTSSAATRR